MRILAAIDNSLTSRRVLETAGTLARLLAADVEVVHVHDSTSALMAAQRPLRILIGDPATALLEAIDDDDVLLVVIGSGRIRTGAHRLGHVTRAVMTLASKAVVVVPPQPVSPEPGMAAKVVVPLDGSEVTAKALRKFLARLAKGGVDTVALHVFNATDAAGQCWDHFYYDFPAWLKAFRQSNYLPPATRLEVGNCPVVAEVLRIAAAEQAMLIAVAWSQDLSPGRAELVTALLTSTRVPVLLLPVATARRRPASLLLAHSGWSDRERESVAHRRQSRVVWPPELSVGRGSCSDEARAGADDLVGRHYRWMPRPDGWGRTMGDMMSSSSQSMQDACPSVNGHGSTRAATTAKRWSQPDGRLDVPARQDVERAAPLGQSRGRRRTGMTTP